MVARILRCSTGVNSGEFIDPFEHSTDVRHPHTAKKPNETTSEETAAAVYARFILERAEPPACVKGANRIACQFHEISGGSLEIS